MCDGEKSSKVSSKALYPELFGKAHSLLIQAQSLMAKQVPNMYRHQVDSLVATCQEMHIKRPRNFSSLIDAGMLFVQKSEKFCPGLKSTYEPMMTEFWAIVEDFREQERRRTGEAKAEYTKVREAEKAASKARRKAAKEAA